MSGVIEKTVTYLGHEFNDFLYAPIYVEKNGMPLTVLSALARHNVDPWHEAAQLVILPERSAILRLTSLILALPDTPDMPFNIEAIIVHLIKLLPRHGSPLLTPVNTVTTIIRIKNSSLLMLFVVFILLILSMQLISRNHDSSMPINQTGLKLAPSDPPTKDHEITN